MLKRNRCVTAHLSLLRSPQPEQMTVLPSFAARLDFKAPPTESPGEVRDAAAVCPNHAAASVPGAPPQVPPCPSLHVIRRAPAVDFNHSWTLKKHRWHCGSRLIAAYLSDNRFSLCAHQKLMETSGGSVPMPVRSG